MSAQSSSSTLSVFTATPARAVGGPVVLATHGHAATDATALAARRCAERLDTTVEAVAVLPPLPLPMGGDGLPVVLPELETDRRAELERTVTGRLERVLGAPDGWHLEVREGDPARVIAQTARERRAGVIVVGAGRHAITDRLLGEEVAVQVVRHAATPVLAVAPDGGEGFRRVVVGIDFGAASIRAAQTALALLEPSPDFSARVTLVHVQSVMPTAPPPITALTCGGVAQIEAMFARLLDTLRPYVPAGVTVDTRIRAGRIVDVLHETAAEMGAELIAVGTHGPDWLERLFVGSIAESSLRRPGRSVLVAPPPAPAERVRLELRVAHEVTLDRPRDWAGALDAFTHRNTGRPARLEVSGPALDGFVLQAERFRFRGAAYDARDRTVELMLGDHVEPTRHLTHGVTRVRHIEVVAESARRDRALLVELADGDAVLTFTD
jgi:nucleotide-binding universal stress UspA family protein